MRHPTVGVKCPACLRFVVRSGKGYMVRTCGFVLEKKFSGRNRSCATLIALRWLMYEHGIRVLHENEEGAVTSRWVSINPTEKLLMTFVRGDTRTGLAVIVGPEAPRPLDLDTAEMLLAEYGMLDNAQVEVASGGFCR